MGVLLTVLSNLVLLGEYTGSVGNVQRFEFSSSPWMAGRAASFAAQLPGLQLGQKEGTSSQQVRTVMVEVIKDDLERAMRKMKRRMKDDGSIRLLRERQSFRKPSELKVLARKERDKRIAKKAFKEKLKWIQNQRSRYDIMLYIHLSSVCKNNQNLECQCFLPTVSPCQHIIVDVQDAQLNCGMAFYQPAYIYYKEGKPLFQFIVMALFLYRK